MRKKIIIALVGCGTFLIILACCAVFGLYYLAGKFFDAQGHALHSGLGAWIRTLEYAEETGKAEYIEEAQKSVTMLKEEVQGWQEIAPVFGLNLEKYKAAQQKAYQTTDNNIKNGMNPLAYLDYINKGKQKKNEMEKDITHDR